jgi:hypothetical protein
MTVVADACHELAQLTPHLAPALTRDNAGQALVTRWETSLSLVNTDVLAAIITLRYQIPAVTLRACELVREPPQRRSLNACLIALPRLDDRLRVLGHAADHRHLETITTGWVRLTKRALGLRKPDIPLGEQCPRCLDERPGELPGDLYVAGAEGKLKQGRDGVTVEWRHDPRVYCPVGLIDPDDPPHSWPQAEWEFLLSLINQRDTRDQVTT